MSAPTKLRGGSDSELTKFKKLWRDSLSESARDFWREQFLSAQTQAATRKLIMARLKIDLKRDEQLNAFRGWLADQDVRDAQAERMLENERRVTESHPDWTLDQVREEVLKQSYFETMATGNFTLGLKTITADLNVKRTDLEARRIAILEKKAAQLDQVKEVIESKLTPEQQRARLKEILK